LATDWLRLNNASLGAEYVPKPAGRNVNALAGVEWIPALAAGFVALCSVLYCCVLHHLHLYGDVGPAVDSAGGT